VAALVLMSVEVTVKVGEEVGVGVVCATPAAPSENVERTRIAKAINLLTD